MVVLGVIALIGGIISAVFGNMQNNDLEAQFNSFFNNGSANPGDVFIYVGIAAAVIGVLLIVIGAIKKKR